MVYRELSGKPRRNAVRTRTVRIDDFRPQVKPGPAAPPSRPGYGISEILSGDEPRRGQPQLMRDILEHRLDPLEERIV